MGVLERACCPTCGYHAKLSRFGLTADGVYNSDIAVSHDMEMRIDHFEGRGRIRVEKRPVTIPIALGLLAALDAARARVRADLQAAGVELDELDGED